MQAKIKTNAIFISRLSVLMNDKRLSQSQLGKLAEISQTSISAYVRGTRSPGAEELSAIARVLGVSMDWLWGMDDKTPTQEKAVQELVELRTRLAVAASALRGALNQIDPTSSPPK